jgi:hypothetical protein
MSANLLRQPGTVHTLTDDLESFLHVLGWTTLHYVPAINGYSALRRGKDMVMFDEHDREEDHSKQGGHLKSYVLGAGRYPSSTYQPRSETPLLQLMQELSKPFKSLYGNPPTAEDREKVNVPKSQYDENLEDLSRDIRRYDRDMEHLQSPSWFVNQVQKAFDRQDWPVDDKADDNLPIAFSGWTQRQVRNRNNQLRHTNSLWESSTGLSRNSKRAASPTPEPSATRRCGTPAVSGTRS